MVRSETTDIENPHKYTVCQQASNVYYLQIYQNEGYAMKYDIDLASLDNLHRDLVELLRKNKLHKSKLNTGKHALKL